MLTNTEFSTQLAADLYGMFVVDAAGKVVAANASASQFWGTGGRSFVGASLANLFATGPDGAEVDESEGQWKAFKAAALDRWTPCRARQAGDSSREVRVRLERAIGGAGSFIAMVRPGALA